ncbi:hypothetical protein [Prevotella pallens]|uniref:hypothetical protein n=1 Tax=Prevotella pallens TaxID=60133 RepID=UPI0028ED840D|nr:hypothetical protein [Prevotella pallens]
MTREEKNEIIQGVIEAIKAQSQDISELPSSDNIEEVKTLPILAKGGVLKSISMDAFKQALMDIIPPSESNSTPAILPFEDFVENVSQTSYSAVSGDVVFDRRNNIFLCKTGSDYCPSWAEMKEYGTPTSEGVTPKEKVIYFHATKHEIYTWYEGVFQKLGSVPAGGGVDNRIRLVNHDTNDTTFALTPNTMHVWGEVENLNLSLAPNTEQHILAEYCFQFTSLPDKATTLSISGVSWYDGYIPAIKTGKTYQGSILNGIIILGEA